jgi:hypothetical protein
MAFELPALPNFSSAVPQGPSPMDQYGKMLQLKSLMGQQQLLPLQVQEQQARVNSAQTENEMQQLQLQGQKALNAYWSNPSQFESTGKSDSPLPAPQHDALAGMLGIAPDDPLMDTVRGQLKARVPAPIAFAEAKNTLQMRQEASKATQEQQGVLKNAFEQLREIASPILAEKDATKKQALIDAAAPGLARWAQFDPTLAKVIPTLHAGNFDAFANRIGAEEKAMGFVKSAADAAKAQEELPGGKLAPVEQAALQDYLKNPNVDKGVPVAKRDAATFLSWKMKQTPAAMVMGNLLPQGDAMDQLAENFSQTGNLPPGLARSPGTTMAIIKRAAELHPDQNLASNKASFKANQQSLGSLQKNFDQVSAFESTAQKNLDLFLEKLKAIPDLGVKFANIPLRKIDDKMIGSDNYQAMKAAQQTAAAETAKVLSSANASGVLSDSQKKEAEDILSGNLSYSAAQKVVATLKQDFSNRHTSYQAQIADIQKRLGGNGEDKGAQGSVKITLPSGKQISID